MPASATRSVPFSRRSFLYATSMALTTVLAGRVFAAGTVERRKVDVCIYGGTSGGVIAAVALARMGRSVLLVEPTRHVGGMTSGGLGWIDFGRASSIGGLTKKYFDAVRDYYTLNRIENNGWSVEPHMAEVIFEKFLADHKVEVIRESRLAGIEKHGRSIYSVSFDKAKVDPDGAPAASPLEPNYLTIEAAAFIDCSYEGDLMAAAGVSHRSDREGRDEFKESYAGISYSDVATERAGKPDGSPMPLRIDPYRRLGDPASGLLPYVSPAPLQAAGSQSPVVQSFNFRLCLTKDDPISIQPPADYDPLNYEIVRRYIVALDKVHEPLLPGDLYFNFGHTLPYSHPRLLKITKLMRGKTDVNSGAGGVSMDFVGGGAERYAKGSWAERSMIWRRHEDYQRGYLHFLRTDEDLPEWLHQEIQPWGLAKDEFCDTGGWPTQLYIRQARRMVGSLVIDQNICQHPVPRKDSIGLGSYSLDSHVCQRQVRDNVVVHEGGFYHRLGGSYPIPYAAIVPRENECENLLVTFCASSTHVAFASVRMEPPFMILSESAAIAVDQALREGTSVQRINPDKLRSHLLDAGQIL